jgi:hypothetical protein
MILHVEKFDNQQRLYEKWSPSTRHTYHFSKWVTIIFRMVNSINLSMTSITYDILLLKRSNLVKNNTVDNRSLTFKPLGNFLR